MGQAEQRPEWKAQHRVQWSDTMGTFALTVVPVENGLYVWRVDFMDEGPWSVTDAHYPTPEAAQEAAMEWLGFHCRMAVNDCGRYAYPDSESPESQVAAPEVVAPGR